MQQNNSNPSIISKIMSERNKTLKPIENLNVNKMTENLKEETTEEENLLKILEFKRSDENCLNSYLISVMESKNRKE